MSDNHGNGVDEIAEMRRRLLNLDRGVSLQMMSPHQIFDGMIGVMMSMLDKLNAIEDTAPATLTDIESTCDGDERLAGYDKTPPRVEDVEIGVPGEVKVAYNEPRS